MPRETDTAQAAGGGGGHANAGLFALRSLWRRQPGHVVRLPPGRGLAGHPHGSKLSGTCGLWHEVKATSSCERFEQGLRNFSQQDRDDFALLLAEARHQSGQACISCWRRLLRSSQLGEADPSRSAERGDSCYCGKSHEGTGGSDRECIHDQQPMHCHWGWGGDDQ